MIHFDFFSCLHLESANFSISKLTCTTTTMTIEEDPERDMELGKCRRRNTQRRNGANNNADASARELGADRRMKIERLIEFVRRIQDLDIPGDVR